MNGYNHAEYAWSLQRYGLPRKLQYCEGWMLERQTPGGNYKDAMGLYPFFVCEDWSKLPRDLEELSQEVVCAYMVTDPFADLDLSMLQEYFRDVFKSFKQHYVVDLSIPLEEIGGKRRRKHARKALNKLEMEVIEEPFTQIDDWMKVYDVLIDKHEIKGIRAFSRDSFLRQFRIPGTIMIRALSSGKTVGAQIYLTQGDVVHAHLGACTQEGYDLDATYALDFYSFQYFRDKARWVDLGGGIGLSNDGLDGLSQYKSWWATNTRQTYFCGRIFDHEKYHALKKRENIPPTQYFPAYRFGEFS